MKNQEVTIFTNGKQLFTLEDYQPQAGVCHANNITIHSKVSKLEARAMHERGQLFYIFGIGDSKHLRDNILKKGIKIDCFKVF
ncbi:hypothetical protein CRP19_000071 [Riemerella phage vB_RanS_CRP19]|nr:hypothetical protein CRP19_000071 [Riemerella phage vB_RanS_CRP19]